MKYRYVYVTAQADRLLAKNIHAVATIPPGVQWLKEDSCPFRGSRGWVKLRVRRPLTSFDLGVACLFRRLTLEPAR